MMDIAKVPQHIKRDLFKAGYTIEKIEKMPPEKAFTVYCEWNGITGWGNILIVALDSLREAQND